MASSCEMPNRSCLLHHSKRPVVNRLRHRASPYGRNSAVVRPSSVSLPDDSSFTTVPARPPRCLRLLSSGHSAPTQGNASRDLDALPSSRGSSCIESNRLGIKAGDRSGYVRTGGVRPHASARPSNIPKDLSPATSGRSGKKRRAADYFGKVACEGKHTRKLTPFRVRGI